MKIEMDRKYRVLDGREVRILCVDAEGRAPVVGILGSILRRWNLDGTRPCGSRSLDLIEVRSAEDVIADALRHSYNCRVSAISADICRALREAGFNLDAAAPLPE